MNDLTKTGTSELIAQDDIRARIITVRGVQVMLDRDLAELYGVETRILNQAVKRNAERFPVDFMFQLTKEECLRSQIVTLKEAQGKHLKYMPFAFTENGVAMLSGVLRSSVAIDINIRIMRAFVAMRHFLQANSSLVQRLESVEMKQLQMGNQLNVILDAMNDKKFPPQKVFFDGEFFDAFEQMKRFVRLAKKELIVIDPYFDDSVLALLAQKRPGVLVTVVQCTRGQRNLHAIDVIQFNQQYANSLTVKVTDKFHDRFLIIDQKTLIHIGASLNYLGKKCFGFSTMDAEMIPDILARIP